MLSGEYLTVVFPGFAIPDAMEMPRNAVFNTNEVFVVNDGKLKKREINIIKVNETSLIFRGLEEGEMLVVEPLINTRENSPVGILGEESTKKGGKGTNQAKSESGRTSNEKGS